MWKKWTAIALLAALLLAGCGGGTPPAPGSITLTVVDAQNVGYDAAYQLGNGAWTPLITSPGTNTYTINLSGNAKYGVAVRCNPFPPGTTPEVHLIQATPSELANPKVSCSPANPSTVSYTLNVDVSGLSSAAANDVVAVSGMGFLAPNTVVNPSNPVTLNLTAPSGTQDLLVTVFAPGNPFNYKAAKVLRNVSVAGGGSSTITLINADVVNLENVTVTSPAGFGLASAGVAYLSKDQKGFGQVGSASGSSANSFTYRPVSGFTSGDRYVVFAVALDSTPGQVLERYKGFSSGPVALTLPGPWSPGSLTTSGAAHPTVSGLNYSGTNLRSYKISLENASLIYQATVSKNWLGNSTSYAVPDLASELGYTAYGSGDTVFISVYALLSPNPVLDLDQGDPASFTATTDISLVCALGSYSVGGGSVNLP